MSSMEGKCRPPPERRKTWPVQYGGSWDQVVALGQERALDSYWSDMIIGRLKSNVNFLTIVCGNRRGQVPFLL